MPVRYGGSNGAITKSYRPSGSQRIARTTARIVIDLTQDSEEDEAGRACEAESDKESEEQQDSEEQGDSDEQEESEESDESEEQEESEEHENSNSESQGSFLRELNQSPDLWTMRATPGISYSVTGYHHRPWGGGDEFHTVGIFNTEHEAKVAAHDDYRETCEKEADGWEYYWQGDPGDEEIILVAKVEDYEVQQETYRGTINRIQHQEKPWSPFVTHSDGTVQGQVATCHIYLVEEQRHRTVQTFVDGVGGLVASRVHYIYRDEFAANFAAQELYGTYLSKLESPKIVRNETRQGLVRIILEDRDHQMSYVFTVEKQQLL